MSHLASPEEFDNPYNETQRARFRSARELFPGVPASLANSSGHFLGTASRSTWCGPGIALYGGNPQPGQPNPLQPVATWWRACCSCATCRRAKRSAMAPH